MNYNKLIKGLFFVALLATVASCSDDESNVFEDPHFASFLGLNTSIVAPENGGTISVELGITEPQNQDVTITFAITDITAVQGVDYTVSSTSVVVPAGEYNSNFTITPVDNDVFNEAKTFTVEITDVSSAGLQVGNFDEQSYFRTVVISNDDCPTESNLWWGNLVVQNVGGATFGGTGSANDSGDCDVLIITSDLPDAGIGPVPFEATFTPNSPGATSGTVEIPSQIYCTNCSEGFDALYSATGTYDEASETIILFYSLDRSDGASFGTGTNIITPE
ncbi:Calx-beta domain-containing protein [Winogradskyella sp. SM1960]|uniref:Calx-beta domain-containing protein n=1 Tax=Winogradskyella sp. SM1960 TaxID=2865955 RepID=UPI001CD542A8|nr:Calx-beta domain-containing protein [Winogradskyella sp. SM1960]